MKRLARIFLRGVTLVSILGLMALPAVALDFDFSGNFTQDNDVLLFNFTVGGSVASNVTVFSSSWLYGYPPPGGGPGGFDPMLGIWTAAGNLIAFQDDGGNIGTTLSNGVLYNHGVWDSYYQVLLDPGNYIASITQFDNFNNGTTLSAGFKYDGTPNFTFVNDYGGATQALFNGVWDDENDPRISFWQFHLLDVAEANVVPVPGTLLLLGSGLIGLAGWRRFRKS